MKKKELTPQTKALIKHFESLHRRYKREAKSKPESLFWAGLVKNTKEYIEQLKQGQ